METVKENDIQNVKKEVLALAQKAKMAAAKLMLIGETEKNIALKKIADKIRKSLSQIESENAKDLENAKNAGRTKAFIDRLTLNASRIEGMAVGLEEMAALPDPIGEILREWTRPNGIKIQQVRVPLGVVGMIYESRPNVTAEAAGLCLKSGNAVILRGGSEAYYSNKILVDIISSALAGTSVPAEAVQLLPPQDRRSITELTNAVGKVDLIVARGSEKMIHEVSRNASVPVMGHGKGLCHVYIDEFADPEKAINIAFNSKVQRPGVCNAMESLLIHKSVAANVLPDLGKKYSESQVEMRGDEAVCQFIKEAKKATPEDWDTEFHDKILSMKVVDSFDEALAHIQAHGSGHTESIVTENAERGTLFQKAVDSSCVMVNASTRLHDGGVFGFGSEIGISTNKLHARGTMGLRELTSTKYLLTGNGQIRE